ncbi:MAG: 2-amino-4-hydroxy-6-hydroxymethyldihydropteridine diphosphokinase [Chloroflexi bacterium]|nr:2-amino-4-hydroxy-6-hydroxymethyldihydropteridine diphosphokinase [Chloroflexota bacterium]
MILVALGANLVSARHVTPAGGLDAALDALAERGILPVARSRWYRSAPVPPAQGSWFVNGVARVETTLSPVPLMAHLLAVEAAFGRRRSIAGADLLDYDGQVVHHAASDHGPALSLPHPRLAERAFVLAPLIEVAPDWRHPVSGATATSLLAKVAEDQTIEPLSPSPTGA